MHINLRALRLGVLLAAVAAARGWAAAPSNEADDFYSRGVRAYFSGNSADAELYLSLALEMRPDDPRLYYFRALALQRQGRMNEARGDIMAGAAHEAAHPQRYAVGSALEGVQGGARLQFEWVRQEGRREAVAQPAAVQLARHESVVFHDEPFLRRPVIVSLVEFLPEADPQLEVEEPYPLEPPPRSPNLQAISPVSEDEAVPPVDNATSLESGDPFVDDPADAAGNQQETGGASSDGAVARDEMNAEVVEEAVVVEERPAGAADPAADVDDFGAKEEDPFGDL